MGKELFLHNHEDTVPTIGGYGIYDELDGGFEQRASTPEEEQRYYEAVHGKDDEVIESDFDFPVITVTPEQEAIHKRVIAAHTAQMEGFEGLNNQDLFTLPKDIFAFSDPAREEQVIVDFRPEEYTRE